MEETKNGGVTPANVGVVSLIGNADASHSKDSNTTLHKVMEGTQEFQPQYSIHQPFAPYYATTPVDGLDWLTPQEEHTDDAPWCREMKCCCHFQHWRMERYFIAPIERRVLDIAEAIDLYHGEPGYMARRRAEAEAREAVLV